MLCARGRDVNHEHHWLGSADGEPSTNGLQGTDAARWWSASAGEEAEERGSAGTGAGDP